MKILLYKIFSGALLTLAVCAIVWKLQTSPKESVFNRCASHDLSTHLSFHWQVDSHAKALFQEGAQAPETSQLDWESDFLWKVLQGDTDNACILKLSVLNSKIALQGYADSADELAKKLNGELEIHITSAGLNSGIRFFETSDLAKNVLRKTLSLLQWTNAAGENWQSIEPAFEGSQKANYRLISKNQMIKMVREPYAANAGGVMIFPQLDGQLFLDNEDNLKKMTISELSENRLDGDLIVKQRVQVALEQHDVAIPSSLSPNVAAGTKIEKIQAPVANEGDQEAAFDENQLKNRSAASVIEIFTNSSKEATIKDYLALKAVLRREPQWLEDETFVSFLEATAMNSKKLRDALLAIAELENDAGQSLLNHVARDRLGRESDPFAAQAVILPLLGGQQKPSVESESLLRELSENQNKNIASTALLALGSMAHQLNGDKRAQGIAADLTQKLRNDMEPAQALAAIGNSGAEGAFAEVRPFLENKSGSVRADAVRAIRFMPQAEIDSILLGLLSHDSDTKVREAAAFALLYRPSLKNLTESLKVIRQNESSENLKMSLDELILKSRSLH